MSSRPHRLVTVLWLAAVLALSGGCSGGDSDTDGGGGGDAGQGDGGGGQALTLDELVDACIRASACGIQTYPSLRNCIAAYQNLYRSLGTAPIYDQLYACVNRARGDCTAVATCFGMGGPCDQSYKAACKGTVAVTCDLISKRVFELDCGDAGLICAIKSGQTAQASCARATCDASFKDTCDGTTALSCSAGVVEQRKCGLEGQVCGDVGGKTVRYGCKGTSWKCTTTGRFPFEPLCDKGKAVTCVGGKEDEDDCAEHKLLNTACSQGQCVAAGSECSGVNECSGSSLRACLDGSWKTYDCAALGLGPCKAAATAGANCSDPAKK